VVLFSLLLPVASASPNRFCSLSRGVPPVPRRCGGAEPLPETGMRSGLTSLITPGPPVSGPPPGPMTGPLPPGVGGGGGGGSGVEVAPGGGGGGSGLGVSDVGDGWGLSVDGGAGGGPVVDAAL